ncbi:MAG: 23S rRNA (guanosine(2251)-2'-O)-methyltransferase RlmB [Alphaproteobacteria bacterium]
MSQKENKFQSKSKNSAPRSGGSKSGGKPGGKSFGKSSGGFGGGKKPAGRSFGKKFEGDSAERRPRRTEGEYKPRREGSDFKPRRPREDGESRPRRDFSDRKPRGDGDFKPRRPREDGEFRPKRDFGDRKPRGDGDFKPRRPREDGEFRPKRDFGDRKPRGDGDFKPRRPREDGEFRPKRDFGDRKPRRDDAERKPRRSFEDRGPSAKRYGEKPGERKFGDRKPRAQTSYEPRQDFEGTDDARRKLKSDRASYGAPSPAYLYGHHAVRAALQNPARHIQRLIVTENGFEQIQEAYDAAMAAGLRRPEPLMVEREDIDRLLPRDAVHQDVMIDAKPLEDVFLQDILNGTAEDTKVIVLDQVTDPHNVGAILRTAAAFGATAVIVQKLHAPEITGTLAKIASGAVEHVPLVREVNLNRALEQLKDAGFTCIGLDERGKVTMAQAAAPHAKSGGRVALVMGAEGDGLRRLVSENCDVLAKLPTGGPIASLNVSNAAAIALYEIIRGNDD